MPSPLQSVQAPKPPEIRRSISLRAPLQTDGPTPPSLLHSPLLNATTRGPAVYPTNSPAVSQPSSRRPSESASSISSSSSRASSHFSTTSSTASITSPTPGTTPSHVQRGRFTSTDPRPPSSIIHTRTSRSWSSPAAPSAGHTGQLDDDPWRILDTVPASPHRDCPQKPISNASTPLSVRAAATTTVPPGIRVQHAHVPHPPLSHHTLIGPYSPPELSSHQQQTRTPTRRFGSSTTLLVSNGVGSSTIQDPDSAPVLRNRPHTPLDGTRFPCPAPT